MCLPVECKFCSKNLEFGSIKSDEILVSCPKIIGLTHPTIFVLDSRIKYSIVVCISRSYLSINGDCTSSCGLWVDDGGRPEGAQSTRTRTGTGLLNLSHSPLGPGWMAVTGLLNVCVKCLRDFTQKVVS